MAEALRVLVVDDSAHQRRVLTEALSSARDIIVVGHAADGEEGLKQVERLEPDVITLDLEMPRLDGFAFLRLLMASRPTPVLVVSSFSHRADVFKALDLGALDFLARPTSHGKVDQARLRTELLEKVRAVREMRGHLAVPRHETKIHDAAVVAIGASTGGPTALEKLLRGLEGPTSLCVLVAQHMPPGFTKAFAERLDRLVTLAVKEARQGDLLAPGTVLIGPGGKHLTVRRTSRGIETLLHERRPHEHHAPSVDQLFTSVASVVGRSALGVVLTGMGSDGAKGTQALAAVGAPVWAESESSAVIHGMPRAAQLTGHVKRTLHLDDIAGALLHWARRSAKG